MLIRKGLEDVDKDNAQTYIEASPAGLQLYLRHGWQEIDAIVIDMRKYGGRDVDTEKILMRPPQKF